MQPCNSPPSTPPAHRRTPFAGMRSVLRKGKKTQTTKPHIPFEGCMCTHPGPLTLLPCRTGVFEALSQESWTVKMQLYHVLAIWFQCLPSLSGALFIHLWNGAKEPWVVVRIKQNKNAMKSWTCEAWLHHYKQKQSTFCFLGSGESEKKKKRDRPENVMNVPQRLSNFS